MSLDKLSAKYPLVMRISMGFVLGWFGVNEIFNPVYWSGYVPPIVEQFLPFDINLFVQMHGIVLSLLALSFFLSLYIRYTGLIAVGVLISIIGGLIMINGFNEIVVRDIGLLGLALSIWLHEIKEK